MAGTSASDMWAVGSYFPDHSVIEHWDGTAWQLVGHPDPPSGGLVAVAAISPNDAWAIGNSSKLLAEHWDGAAWTLFPIPLPPSYAFYLYGISAVSTDDVWMVGDYTGQGGIHPLAEHWDGARWTLVPAPDGSDFGTNGFYDVSAGATDDVWAVGYQDVTGGADFQPLVEHWDGMEWSVVQTPPLPGLNNQLFGVSAVSVTNAWAVGLFEPSVTEPLVEHWDGMAWSLESVPRHPGKANEFNSASATSGTDAWAVGVVYSQRNDYRPRADHWDGSQWKTSVVPYPGTDAIFLGTAMLSSSDVWAVGATVGDQGETPLIEHYTDPCQ